MGQTDIRLIIFDFDGTLGDTRRHIVTTMQATIAELQLAPRSEAACAATIGLPLADCFGTMYPDLSKAETQRCSDTYRRIFAENVEKLRPQPFPGVQETMPRLRQLGCTLAIASSRSHASLVQLTADMGIADCFAIFVGADDVERAKPAPEPVERILSALNTEARHTLVVGDMAVDILMGRHAGALTCGVTWGNGTKAELQEAGADVIVSTMEAIPDLLTAGITPKEAR
ncbi:MAG: HAD family hydrolase [Prevotella sp.]|nr:HAD family hydrolase [Prevotella sp.]